MSGSVRDRHFRRRLAIGFALAGLVGCAPEPQPPTNLLLIVVDTLRADRLGAYGAARETSPSLDRLAASSVRFARAYATAPWTKPSVASIFTGLYPSAHRAHRVKTALPDEASTLAEVLARHAYRTAGVVSHDVLRAYNGFAQGFETYLDEEARGHDHVSTQGVTQQAITQLDELARGEAPFFLFVHYFDPHYNYVRHPEYGFAAERAGRLDGSQSLVSLRKLSADLTPEEVALLRDLYDEEIRFTDAGIGRLLARLAQSGRDRDTVVIVTADHGEEFLEHGWLGHTRNLYDGLLRVPLLVRAPGVTPTVVETPVSLVSVLPTALALLGIASEGLAPQGPSLLPLMRGEVPAEAPLLHAEVDFVPVFDPSKRAAKRAVIGTRFKLIRDDDGGALELYDLEEDPEEMRDLAARQPARVARLSARLREQEEAVGRGALETEAREPSHEELLLLQRLGYGN